MPTLLESPTPLRRTSKTVRFTFIPTQVSGDSYYRMCQFAWKMRRHPHVEAVVFPFSFKDTISNPWQNDIYSSNELRRRLDYVIDKADVVVWQMLSFQHTLEFFMDMKTKHQKPFLMDLDDYIDDIPVENEAFSAFQPGSSYYKVARQQIRLSDGLIVSTPYLAEQYASRHNSIQVIPNSIDFDEWKGLEGKRHDRLRVGWIGGGTHAKDLEIVKPVMDGILRDFPDVWFYVIHGVPGFVKDWGKAGRHVYWTHKWAYINLYPKFMASFKFDIGIAPLVDNNFNRGKSNLRWLEYSALKLPCVASPLPDFTRSIHPGDDGFIAHNDQDWDHLLRMLITQESKRREIGQYAFEEVKENFNARKTADQYMRLLKEYC